MAIGDSKTLGNNCCASTKGYQDELVANLTAAGSTVTRYSYAQGGHTVAMMMPLVPAVLFPTVTIPPDYVLLSLGTVDVADVRTGTVTEANWQMRDMVDMIHTEWPNAQVRLMRVWRRTYEPECDTIAAWEDTIISTRSSWLAVGPDERTFLVPHTTDGIHPNPTGYSITAMLWQRNLGY